MVSACLISSTLGWDPKAESVSEITDESQLLYNHLDGPSDEEVYLAGEYTTLLCLSSHLISSP